MNTRLPVKIPAFALAALLVSGVAFAAGPPAASYPERVGAPGSDSERDERCAKLALTADRSGGRMARQGPLSRLNVFKIRHRSHERFLKEYCGDVSEGGLPLSHRAVATGAKPPLNHPDITTWDHPVHWHLADHGGGHDEHHGGKGDHGTAGEYAPEHH